MNNRIEITAEAKARYAFDAKNDVEPTRTIAEWIAEKYGVESMHPLVDDIAHAIEDARDLGVKRAKAGIG